MNSTQQVGNAVGAHLVGGLQAPDAEAAMRIAARILGRHVVALPDGETGARSQWIFWQIDRLTAIDGIELAGTHQMPAQDNPDYGEFPALAVAPTVEALPPRSLGYADAAESSYAIFRRLRDEGAVPGDVKFQVSIPTPYATVVAWVRADDQERFFPVYADAIAAEVAEIAKVVPPADLVVQYDVAVEVGALSGMLAGAAPMGEESFVVASLREALDRTPSGERGLHFCYGDYKHRHFTVPEDLSLCVRLANTVGDPVDFLHMPADRETGRAPGYYEPLRDLAVSGRLSLGVVDYEGDAERTRELIQAATAGSGGMEFAVATECGMARIDERHAGAPSLERLLELHAEEAAPIR
jgi:hypothetical protein